MLTSLFWTLAGFVFTGGSLWILALFVPSAALLLKAALDFARSPLGLVLAAVVAGFLLFTSGWVAGDLHGTAATRAAWRASDVAKATAARRRIAENKLAAAIEADKRITEITAYSNSLAEKVKRYELESKPRGACRLTDDDVRRLRDIR